MAEQDVPDEPEVSPAPVIDSSPIELAPGIYPGKTFDEYMRIAAVNFSVLTLFKNTPAHARVGMLQEDVPTPTQRLGYLVHMGLLEPERFEQSVAVAPKLDKRTTTGKQAWAAFSTANAGRELLRHEEMAICRGIQRSAMQHASAREILRGPGASEITIVWHDKETGLPCKSRIDRAGELGRHPIILDVKTSGDYATLRNFQRSIGNFSYGEQAAMYLTGLQAVSPLPEGAEPRKFLWLVAETFPPYCVRLFEIEDQALDEGYAQFRKHLHEYKHCLQSDSWPAYPGGVELAGLPPWMQKAFDATL